LVVAGAQAHGKGQIELSRFVGQRPKELLIVLGQDKALVNQFVVAGQAVAKDFFGNGDQLGVGHGIPGVSRGRDGDQSNSSAVA
jgi:hypothetical protein